MLLLPARFLLGIVQGVDNSKFALLMYNKASLDIPYEALCEVGPAPKTAL